MCREVKRKQNNFKGNLQIRKLNQEIKTTVSLNKRTKNEWNNTKVEKDSYFEECLLILIDIIDRSFVYYPKYL